MSIVKGFDIVGSALSAQRTRLNAVSSNLANAETTRTAEGGPYARRLPVFQTVEEGEDVMGVEVTSIEKDPTPGPMIYDPGHPLADATGHYAGSNVDLVIEVADAREAQRSYEANLRMFDQTRQMAKSLLDLLRR